MSEKTREICTVVSQESIGAGIYSMWIQTDQDSLYLFIQMINPKFFPDRSVFVRLTKKMAVFIWFTE
jgi:hypothetical protein